MRRIAIITLAAAGLTMAACSRDTTDDLQENVEQAGDEIQQGAQDVMNDPDVREAGDAIEGAAKEAGAAVKNAAGELGDAVHDASDDNEDDVPPADKAE